MNTEAFEPRSPFTRPLLIRRVLVGGGVIVTLLAGEAYLLHYFTTPFLATISGGEKIAQEALRKDAAPYVDTHGVGNFTDTTPIETPPADSQQEVSSRQTPTPDPPHPIPSSTPLPAPQPSSYLQSRLQPIQQVVSDFSGETWGISVHDSSTNEFQSIDGDRIFVAASTTKLITACAYLHKVEQGKYDLNDPLGEYTEQFQLEQLINQSNNDSWDLFFQLMGTRAISDYAQSVGITNYNVLNNTDTPRDIDLLLEKLSSGNLLTPHYTQLLLGYMQNTEEERFLPSGTPPSVALYHKIGLLDDSVHDVGIFVLPSRTITVAIYSSGHGEQEYDTRALAFKHIAQIITH
jgi:beta-lactamase class A